MRKLLIFKILIISILVLSDGVCAYSQEWYDSLRSANVYPRSLAKTLVRKAAKDFHKNICRNYISILDYSQVSYSNGTPCIITANNGLYASLNYNFVKERLSFNDTYLVGRFLPLSTFSTSFYLPGSDSPLEELSVSDNRGSAYEDYLTKYDLFSDFAGYRRRALELLGPMNPKQFSAYEYNVVSKDGDKYIVSFVTKPSKFLKQTRLRVSGLLYLDEEGRITKIETKNMEDRYSLFLRIQGKGHMPTVADYTFVVEYTRNGSSIFLKSIDEVVTWKKEVNKNAMIYFSPESAPYRNPAKYGLKKEIHYKFSNYQVVQKGVFDNSFPAANFFEPEFLPQEDISALDAFPELKKMLPYFEKKQDLSLQYNQIRNLVADEFKMRNSYNPEYDYDKRVIMFNDYAKSLKEKLNIP